MKTLLTITLLLTFNLISMAQDALPLETGEHLHVNRNDSLISSDKSAADRITDEQGAVERGIDTTMVTPAPTSTDSLRKQIAVSSAVRIRIDSSFYDGKVTFINQADSMVGVVFRQDSLNQYMTYKLSDLMRMQPIPSAENSGLATVMKLDTVSTQKPAPPSPDLLFEQGTNDAKLFYRGYKAAATCTVLSALAGVVITPFPSLIIAVATATSTPGRASFTFPPDSPSQNEHYLAGYSQQAKRIKSKKVWTSFAVATGIVVTATVVFIVAVLSSFGTGK